MITIIGTQFSANPKKFCRGQKLRTENFTGLWPFMVPINTHMCGKFHFYSLVREYLSNGNDHQRTTAEAVFLVVCDPSMNDLWATNSEVLNKLLKMKIMEFLASHWKLITFDSKNQFQQNKQIKLKLSDYCRNAITCNGVTVFITFLVLFVVFDSIFNRVIVVAIDYKMFKVFTWILCYFFKYSVLAEKIAWKTLITIWIFV